MYVWKGGGGGGQDGHPLTSTPFIIRSFLNTAVRLLSDGVTLTVELFKHILSEVLTKDDHKSVPLQKLITFVRDDVLTIVPLVSYRKWLEKKGLPVPESLIQKLEAIKKKKSRAGGVGSGLRAIMAASKWRRSTKSRKASLAKEVEKNRKESEWQSSSVNSVVE